MQGTVKVFNQTRGFGFIGVSGEDDIFFHITEIPDEIEPIVGTQVSFETEVTPKGMSAKKIKIVK